MDKKTVVRCVGACCLAAFAIGVYFSFDPSAHRLFPKCLVYVATGYRCPGCGIQRLFHHLLHGDILTAIHYNYLAAIVLPWILASSVLTLLPQGKHVRRLTSALTCRTVAYIYIALYLIWWIVRNIYNL